MTDQTTPSEQARQAIIDYGRAEYAAATNGSVNAVLETRAAIEGLFARQEARISADAKSLEIWERQCNELRAQMIDGGNDLRSRVERQEAELARVLDILSKSEAQALEACNSVEEYEQELAGLPSDAARYLDDATIANGRRVEAERALSELEAATRWHRVENGKPEAEISVLGWWLGDEVHVIVMAEDGEWYAPNGDNAWAAPIYWREVGPLPAITETK